MRNFFSKNRRGEDGEIALGIFLIVMAVFVFIMISMFFYLVSVQAEEKTKQGETASTPHERNISWVTDTGSAIEEWMIAHPKEKLPTAEDYVLYDDFKANLANAGESFPIGEKTYIRVLPTENNDGSFIVCGYYSHNEEVDLKDMDIYSFDTSTGHAERQTRGVCLL